MKEFNTITEAFEWFMENKLAELPTQDRRSLKDVKHDYYADERGKVSEKRMRRVLTDYGVLETVHCYKFGR